MSGFIVVTLEIVLVTVFFALCVQVSARQISREVTCHRYPDKTSCKEITAITIYLTSYYNHPFQYHDHLSSKNPQFLEVWAT